MKDVQLEHFLFKRASRMSKMFPKSLFSFVFVCSYRAPLRALRYNQTAVKDTHLVGEENTKNLAFKFPFSFLSHSNLAIPTVLKHHIIFTALNFVIILFLKLRKNSMLLSKKRNRERQNENWEKNRKWIIGLRFKFAFVDIFHFPIPVLVSRSPLQKQEPGLS